MRAPTYCLVMLSTLFLTACGPEDRSPEFYSKSENAAEFAKALEFCKTSGLSQKDRCGAVWQAKMAMDKAEDRELFEPAILDRAGITLVPQSPKPGPAAVPDPKSSRKASNAETAEADADKQPARN